MASDEETKTEVSEGPAIWYPSVETADDLYALAETGARCRVLSEGVVYLYFDGQWRSLGKPPDANSKE